MAALAHVRASQDLPLASVPRGASAIILRVQLSPEVARQLAQLGVIPGAEVVVLRSASFGGPLFVEIRGASILLARKLTRKILVRILP